MPRIGWKIKNLRRDLNLTQLELGKQIGVPQATVAKWENDKQEPRRATVQKLAELAGVSALEFSGISTIPVSAQVGRQVEVITSIQAGAWRSAVEWEPTQRFPVPVILPRAWDNVPVIAAEVDGDSMNRFYPDGSIVFIAPLEYVPGGLRHGQHVVVIKHEHGEYEVTLKEYVIDELGKKWLWPRSSSPQHQTPVQWNRDAEIEIRGIVVGATIVAPGVPSR